MNHAELTAITPLTLLTNPYASNADMPSLLNDSRLNFALLVKNSLTVERRELLLVCRLLICDDINSSSSTVISGWCNFASPPSGSSPLTLWRWFESDNRDNVACDRVLIIWFNDRFLEGIVVLDDDMGIVENPETIVMLLRSPSNSITIRRATRFVIVGSIQMQNSDVDDGLMVTETTSVKDLRFQFYFICVLHAAVPFPCLTARIELITI